MTLKEYLEKTGLSRAAAAERLGIGQGHLCDLVHRKKAPSLALTEKIYKLTGGKVTPPDLLKHEAA